VCMSRNFYFVYLFSTVVNNQIHHSGSCSSGWSEFNGRCLRYFSVPVTWATAQKNCVSLQANLASVHNIDEFDEIQRLLMAATNEYKAIWIGGSDAEEVGTWLWSDGSPFHFSHWCPGEPNNGGSRGDQHCLEMNDRGSTCWDDQQCYEVRPFVCAKRI
uniref:C-type lectin domain-containing protein n=1 Tax=Poecilia formosa TaxID=48698 RepID=A0A096MH78_POEFO